MFLQTLKMALKSIGSSKMRSFLTMLGIIIGVTALVVMVSLVNGATGAVTSEISDLGNDMIMIAIEDDKGDPYKISEIDDLESLETISQASPVLTSNLTAKYGYNDEVSTVYGITAAFYDIQGLELNTGRFIKTTDIDNSSYIAVLSYKAAEEIFERTDIIGEYFTIDGMSFKVVGLLEEDTSMMSSYITTLDIYVPYSTLSRMTGISDITSIYAAANEAYTTYDADDEVEEYLMDRFDDDEEAFKSLNLSSITDALDSVNGYLTILLGGIAGVSLLVGGVGIMNIMLVSVTERTKEIGIRKAIGAGRASIMMQFLIEALLLSLFGCLLGLMLSWGLLNIATAIAGNITFSMSLNVVVLAVVFSSAIGLLFGLYPANKAAKKHPIDALRYEG